MIVDLKQFHRMVSFTSNHVDTHIIQQRIVNSNGVLFGMNVVHALIGESELIETMTCECDDKLGASIKHQQ